MTGPQDCTQHLRTLYQRRSEALSRGLEQAGWIIQKPEATMFLWAKIPEHLQYTDSFAFAKMLVQECGILVSPGIAFGTGGEGYVRFSLIHDEAVLTEIAHKLRHINVQQSVLKQA